MRTKYTMYRRRKFNDWRDRVKKHLPLFVTKFYSINKFIDYSQHKRLGRVILGINDPFYSIQNSNGQRVDYTNEMALEVVLEIEVCELFAFIQNNAPN